MPDNPSPAPIPTLVCYTAYTSKTYTALLLLFVAAFGCVIFFGAWARLPLFARLGFGALITLGVVACLASLCSSRPVIEADEEGVLCYRLIMKKIPWHDIVAVDHLPRVQKLENGQTTFCLSENWRPIDLYITNIEKYTGGLSSWALRRSIHRDAQYPGAVRLRFDPTGTTARSQDLYDIIRHYIDLHSSARPA